MNSLERKLAFDTEKLEGGAIVKHPEAEEVELKILFLGCPRFMQLREARRDDMTDEEKALTVGDEDVNVDARLQAIAECVLVDWSGVVDDDGNDIPFSDEEMMRMLRNPNMSGFRNWLVQQAAIKSNYRASEVAASGEG